MKWDLFIHLILQNKKKLLYGNLISFSYYFPFNIMCKVEIMDSVI